MGILGKAIMTSIHAAGNFLSAAVGNSPEDIRARKDLGIPNAAAAEERELGIPAEKPPTPARRRGYHHS